MNNKKLIAGDSLVFMKDSAGNVFVGFHRVVAISLLGALRYVGWKLILRENEEIPRKGRGKLLAKRQNWTEFAIWEIVENALNVQWTLPLGILVQ